MTKRSIGLVTLAASMVLACKHEPEKDVTKRKMSEQTVTITGIEDKSVRLKVKVPEGFSAAKTGGITFWGEEQILGPTITFALRLESSAPKDAKEALRFNNQDELKYASHDLPDGFVVTNTPNGSDANYYTIAVRRPAGLPALPSKSKFYLHCEIDYLGARGLHDEKEIVKWMESTCADATVVP